MPIEMPRKRTAFLGPKMDSGLGKPVTGPTKKIAIFGIYLRFPGGSDEKSATTGDLDKFIANSLRISEWTLQKRGAYIYIYINIAGFFWIPKPLGLRSHDF